MKILHGEALDHYIFAEDGRELQWCEIDTEAKTYRRIVLHFTGEHAVANDVISPIPDASQPYHYEDGTYDRLEIESVG